MTESEFRINIANNINNILKSIYYNASNTGFDPLVDLSDIPSTTLKDFWLYTAGFLGLKNQKDFDNMLTDEEVDDILKGGFRLIDLPLDQAQEFARRSKKKVPDKGSQITIDLYSVQDGTYSIKKGFKDEDGNVINCLALETDPLEYHTDTPPEEFKPSHREILKTLRNVFAHRTPIKRGKKLVFEKGNDEIVVSKMWLRGYSELFCRKSNTLNSNTIENILIKEASKNNNYISTKQELDSLLSSVKNLFGEEINQNFYKLTSFIQTRLSSQPDFYSLPIENKVKQLSAILANNTDYIKSNKGYINPSIIYNLQQLIGLELYSRNEVTELDVEDYDIMKMKKVVDEIASINTKTNGIQLLLNSGKNFCKSAQQKYLKSLGSMKSKVRSYLKSLEDKQKLESANMDLYNLEDLNHLPYEVAVNTVLLMCFNSLVTSSFYDDVLSKTNTSSLTQKQEEFFDKFDVSKFDFYYGNAPKKQQYPGQKAYFLLCLREALCHGNITYKLPQAKKGTQANIQDTMICFETSERQNSTIYGTLQDFYDLFSSKEFLTKRHKEVITGTTKEMTFEEQTLSKQDEENFKNLNEIVKELREIDEEFKRI